MKNDEPYLFQIVPEAKIMWNSHKDPAKYDKNSKAIIEWKCTKGHSFKKAVDHFIKNPTCPTCIKEGKRLTNNQKAIQMWDYEKNKIRPEDLTLKSVTPVWWKCRSNHSFKRNVSSFIENSSCPFCSRDTVVKHPDLMKFWDWEQNDLDPATLFVNSSKIVTWKCPNCGHSWKTEVASRYGSKNLCPCCEVKVIVKPGYNDIFTLYPDLKKDFIEKENNFNPRKEGSSSKILTNWTCHVCGYKWSTGLSARIKGRKIVQCPACSGHVRTKTYPEKYPKLIPKYSSMNEMSFSELTSKDYHKKQFWECDIHGTFEQYLSAMIRGLKTKNGGCPYCAGKKVKVEDSFATKYPDLLTEFSKKNNINPYELTYGSSKLITWKCKVCGNEWETELRNRTNGLCNCPQCNPYNRYEQMLYEIRPDLEEYYIGEKAFTSFSYMSNQDAQWRCHKGHEFTTMIMNMTRHDEFYCPVCNYSMLLPGVNDLKALYPTLAKMYDRAENTRESTEVMPNDSLPSNWICEKGHKFTRSVVAAINSNVLCPVCERTILSEGDNDALTTYSELSYYWDESNFITPNKITDRNNDKYTFHCSHGHKFNMILQNFISNKFECPICTDKWTVAGVNDLPTTHPELAKQWSTRNERPVSSIRKNLAYYAYWICPNCGNEYLADVKDRSVGDELCPYCNDKRLNPGINDLVTVYPELAAVYSNNNEVVASEYLVTRNSRLKWICPDCGGEYNNTLTEMLNGADCPYCNNILTLKGFNDIPTTHPELIKRWSDRNDRSIYEFRANSYNDVIWHCEVCGGEFVKDIKSYVSNGCICPYCAGEKVLPGFNDFASTYPDIAKDWCVAENLLIGVGLASDHFSDWTKRVWWKCPECGNKYLMSIQDRIIKYKRSHNPCSICCDRPRNKAHFI